MLKSLVRLARPSQWLKNGVVLAALVFSGEAIHISALEVAALAIAIFCLLSSSVYVLNDLVDRDKDRRHPLKKGRPIASGQVSPTAAISFCALLLVVALTGAWFINWSFFIFRLG